MKDQFNTIEPQNATYVLNALNKIFRKLRGYVFRLPKKNDAVVVLLSGGIDSICLWYLLMKKYQLHVYPLYVAPDKISEGELKSINYYSTIFRKLVKKQFHDISIVNNKSNFSFNTLRDKTTILYDFPTLISNIFWNKSTGKYALALINSPARFGYYNLAAYEYALTLKYKMGIDVETVLLGLVPEDASAIRESRLITLRSFNLSFCLTLGNNNWQFTAPLEKQAQFYYQKKDLILFAKRHNISLNKTWSCISKNDIHCGQCYNCQSRRNILNELNIQDFTHYSNKKTAQSLISRIYKKCISLFSSIIVRYSFQNKSAFDPTTVITPRTKIIAASHIVCREMNKQCFLLNKKAGDMVTLNHSAYTIMQQIAEKPHTLLYIKKIIKNIYKESIPYEDIEYFIKASLRRGDIVIFNK